MVSFLCLSVAYLLRNCRFRGGTRERGPPSLGTGVTLEKDLPTVEHGYFAQKGLQKAYLQEEETISCLLMVLDPS